MRMFAAAALAAGLVGLGAASARADAEAEIDAYVQAYVDYGAFDGVVLILQDGAPVYERAFGVFDARTGQALRTDNRFLIASLSKQFTQIAIGRLVEAGAIELDAPVSAYLPDFPRADEFSVAQLLDHSAGVAHTNTLPWMDTARVNRLPDIIAALSQEALLFEPGTDTAYSNGGYALLAAIIESVSGRSFGAFVEQQIADRGFPSIGHQDFHQVVPGLARSHAPGVGLGRRSGTEPYLVANRIGGGSLYGSARDVAAAFRASFRGEVLGAELTEAFFAMPRDGDILITGRNPGALAQVYYDIEDDLTVVTLSSNGAWPASLNQDVTALWRGETVALIPVEPVAATPAADLASASGTYQPEYFAWSVALSVEEGRLIYTQGHNQVALVPMRGGGYYLPLWDWMCAMEATYQRFTCRQRRPEAEVRFRFDRASPPPRPD